MNKFLLQIIISFFFFYSTLNFAQSRFSHEIGGYFGIASLQTDFGDSGDFASANQSNMAVGLTHYLKFFGSQYSWRSGGSYFSDHFKLKTEFLYTNNTNITHDGKSAQGSSENAEKLRAMTAAVKLYNIGVSLEYYFLRLEDYASFYAAQDKLNPYISLGITWSYYDPDIMVNGVSLPANSDPYESLIPKWQNNSIYVDANSSFGATAGLGLRYSIEFVDLYLAGQYQYFFNDDIEGLDAILDPANTSNDSMVLVTLGVVYVFGK
jgi:hypothetical protein